ncbi:MAG: magnesium/cobalt transporter CorA [Bacteroidota bacterium]
MKKQFDVTRPDKLLVSRLKTLISLPNTLYSAQKSTAKGKAEITFIGEKKLEKVETQLYKFDKDTYDLIEGIKEFDMFPKKEDSKIYWLNFHGLHEVDLTKELGESLKLDRITVRQVLDTTLRPKVEEYDHYIFFSIKSILKDEVDGFKVEQLSFILGYGFVISFQEEISDHFDHIRNKIEDNLGLIRKRTADFLVFQLLDAILDNYFETIEQIGLEVNELEKMVFKEPKQEALVRLEQMKQSSEMIKKALNPFKDALRILSKRQTAFVLKENNKYYKEVLNTCMSAVEEIDSTIKSLESLTNIYFSSLSQKMNETMKVLTTVATTFIPLTFIAGVYGMNFNYMPELQFKYGYFTVWGVMGIIFIGMLVYFKRKGWL